jgi:hypothetical protein
MDLQNDDGDDVKCATDVQNKQEVCLTSAIVPVSRLKTVDVKDAVIILTSTVMNREGSGL